MDTNSEDWRAECEARMLAKRTVNEIKDFLERVEKARGKPAADRLRLATRELWRKK